MSRIAIVVALGFVVAGLWMSTRAAAQSQNRRGKDAPPPTTSNQEPQHKQEIVREKVVVAVNHIPTFMQAGRHYVFEPVGGREFSGRVISLDSTGWVQVQLRPGPDVGPIAEWFNLANMVSVKAMN